MTTIQDGASDWAYSELVARVYELDKPAGTSFGDVEFYLQRLAGVTGPVLEPAVGTGRFLVPLLQHGFLVRGYDLSEHMLRICRDNCARAGLTAVRTAGVSPVAASSRIRRGERVRQLRRQPEARAGQPDLDL